MNITLKWEQKDKYWMSSDNYRISKQFLSGDAVYTAWVRGKPWKSLQVCKTIDKAKAACELHYMRTLK